MKLRNDAAGSAGAAGVAPGLRQGASNSRCWYAAGAAGADGASGTASVSAAVGAAGARPARLARLRAQAVLQTQLALIGVAADPTEQKASHSAAQDGELGNPCDRRNWRCY